MLCASTARALLSQRLRCPTQQHPSLHHNCATGEHRFYASRRHQTISTLSRCATGRQPTTASRLIDLQAGRPHVRHADRVFCPLCLKLEDVCEDRFATRYVIPTSSQRSSALTSRARGCISVGVVGQVPAGFGIVRAFGRAEALLEVGLRGTLVCGCVGRYCWSSLPDPFKE